MNDFSVLFRNLRPVVEIVGEFGARFAMTRKYNNALISLRQRSPLSKAMLDFACKYPRNQNLGQFCKEVGLPCHQDWWYNHGPQAWASKQEHLGFVTLPLALFDPGNDCYGRGLLSGSGSHRMNKWKLSELLEMIRGAYAMHTRSYEVKKRPMADDAQFSVLFRYIKQRLQNKTSDAAEKVGVFGTRSDSEQVLQLGHTLVNGQLFSLWQDKLGVISEKKSRVHSSRSEFYSCPSLPTSFYTYSKYFVAGKISEYNSKKTEDERHVVFFVFLGIIEFCF